VVSSGDTTAPAISCNLIISNTSPTSVSPTWDPVPDADLHRYDVYRGFYPGGPYTKIAEVLAPTFSYIDGSVTTRSSEIILDDIYEIF